MSRADYRKYNDRSLNSSKYHKLDGTPVRAILKEEARREIMETVCHALEPFKRVGERRLSLKKTCGTCLRSDCTSETCYSHKWLIFKHSDRGSAINIIKNHPELKGKLSRKVSYWKSKPKGTQAII